MNQLTKKKKKGFTLIELIAVIAIIGILAAVLVPKVIGYMEDAKRSKVVAQARTVVMAFETYNGKESNALSEGGTNPATIASLQAAMNASPIDYTQYADLSKLDAIANGNASTITIAICREAADGKKSNGTPAIVKIVNGKWAGAFEEAATSGGDGEGEGA